MSSDVGSGQSGSDAVSAMSARTRYHWGWKDPAGWYWITNKRLVDWDRAVVRAGDKRAEWVGSAGKGGWKASTGSISAKEGKGEECWLSIRTGGFEKGLVARSKGLLCGRSRQNHVEL